MGALEVLVGSVALAVYAVECGLEVRQVVGFLAVDVSAVSNPKHGYLLIVIVYAVDGPVISHPEAVTFTTH